MRYRLLFECTCFTGLLNAGRAAARRTSCAAGAQTAALYGT